jgi:hypothetical protein
MQVEAIPTQFVTATAGQLRGRDHVILYLRPAGHIEARGYALNSHDAKRALAALALLVADSDRVELRIVREEATLEAS